MAKHFEGFVNAHKLPSTILHTVGWTFKIIFALVVPLWTLGQVAFDFDKAVFDIICGIFGCKWDTDDENLVVVVFAVIVSIIEVIFFIADAFFLSTVLNVRDMLRGVVGLPLFQSSLLLGSNAFTFARYTSARSVIFLGFHVMGFLSLEASIDAHDLNLSTTMMSVMMAMASSCVMSGSMGWWGVAGVWLYGTLVFFIAGKLYIPAPKPRLPEAGNGGNVGNEGNNEAGNMGDNEAGNGGNNNGGNNGRGVRRRGRR